MTLSFMQLLPIILVFLLYFFGMPIVYALFGSTFFFFLFIDQSTPSWTILQKVMNSTQSFSMLAIPFFVMSGSVMNFGGISDKMMDFCECVTGHMRGGLAQVNVLLSMLMGGCSGSANADCAMQSKMLVPEMERRGYSKAFSAAITAASSAATPVIPPGVNLIIFTLIAQASLGRTFAAGYVPGILMSVAMMITVAIIAKKRNYPTTRDKFPPLTEVLKQAFISFWGLFFPFGIILGMRFGLFTPSEGGAVAVLYCFIIGKLVYKRLSFREHLIPIILDTIAGTSSVVLIMVSANVFGQYMTWINLPKIVATSVLGLTSNKYVFLMLCNVVLLIMGMFLEGGAAMMIITPLLLPVALKLGVNVYHFGLVTICNIMIGGLTPPFGSMMFTTCGITGCKISNFIKEVWPFIVALFLVLILITFCPILVTIVPDLIYGPAAM
ncbi:tripartite ATP-independent transporter DctM subunit [Moryella indoligenes]|uniref:Tripartite ATP-independent transporter DctM subunit n=1 Tax=Moryella indoligenes TaxID=371674 RepID=A0AAE4AK99_9FIRM|nr:TRAP transporter large permease [Moryella indoligenes]MDQ0152663.1 tripartite ATP-independent transporter DctM subunit [Moryella indoligenes]